LNPAPASSHFSSFFTYLGNVLFTLPWSWWVAGICIGLTAVGLAWVTGRRLGVTGGYEDACSAVTNDASSFRVSPSQWKFWFILGLPLGSFLANLGHWHWTWLYGRLDAVTFASLTWKIVWLAAAGVLIGFGARWARGCVSGNGILGVSLGSKASIYATLAFLAAGIILANLLFKVM
jgi:uncharacterized membrane protein YedE/YeeE